MTPTHDTNTTPDLLAADIYTRYEHITAAIVDLRVNGRGSKTATLRDIYTLQGMLAAWAINDLPTLAGKTISGCLVHGEPIVLQSAVGKLDRLADIVKHTVMHRRP